MITRIALFTCLFLTTFALPGQCEVWNMTEDFSISQNPNGAWSYGWRTHPEDALSLYGDTSFRCGAPGELECWNYYIEDYCPRVTRNPQDHLVMCDYTVFAAHTVNFHPGPAQQSVIRWTAPASMTVALSVQFEAIDYGTSVVHVYQGTASLFALELDHQGQVANYTATISCQAGDVIECAVDPISFYADSVRLDFVVQTADPTPVSEITWGSIKRLYR